MTLSDDTVIANSKPLQRYLKQVKRLHKAVTRKPKGGNSRKPKGGNSRKQAVRKLGAQYRRVAHLRANTPHQADDATGENHKSGIVIEDLQVAGMLKNHLLALAIADVVFARFRWQLTYKAAWYGSRVVVSQWEPTSERCSQCGRLDADLTLADRLFQCEVCGLTLDRDLNAAINLANLVRLATRSADTENADGADWSGRRSQGDGKTVLGEAGTNHVWFPRG